MICPRLTRFVRLATILTVSLCLCMPAAYAQSGSSKRALGFGAQVGNPSGFTLKYYPSRDIGVVFLGSWSIERFLLYSMHVTYEYPIPDSPLRFFIGPGMDIGREVDEEMSDLRISASIMPGLNFFTQKFEVFLQALPGVKLMPRREVTLGGAVGLRYFF